MKIVCFGGGPAGLYFALSMKLRNSSHDITIIERNSPDQTFGWGVVLSDDILIRMELNDPQSANAIRQPLIHRNKISVVYKSQTMTSGGLGFSGIGRFELLWIGIG